MAYRYNELTGEFEDIPQDSLRTSGTSRRSSSSQSFRPAVPTRQSDSPSRPSPALYSNSHSSSGSKISEWLSGLGILVLRILPYIIISATVSMCN